MKSKTVDWDAFNRTLHNGAVALRLRAEIDHFGYDLISEEARFTTWRHTRAFSAYPKSYPHGFFLYSRRDDTMYVPSAKAANWRDRKGHIVAEPEPDDYSRNCQFIEIPAAYADRLRYAFALADRLESYERQDWCYMHISCTVSLDGAEIGHASLCGIESDSAPNEVKHTAADVAHEAIDEARAWLDRRGH